MRACVRVTGRAATHEPELSAIYEPEVSRGHRVESMISAISTTPILPATRTASPQAQQADSSDPRRGAEGAQHNRSASNQGAEAARQAEATELAATDREVRAHEAAHLAAAGGLAQGGASFDTVRGPDGRAYAVGGEVSIDVSPGRTPEETIAKAQQIRSAALAPADPSAQDFQVAAQAAQMAHQARQELATQQATQGTDGASSGTAGNDASGRIAQALSALDGTTASAGAQLNLFA